MQFLESLKKKNVKKVKIILIISATLFMWWILFAPSARFLPSSFDPNGPSLKAIAHSDPLGAIIAIHIMHDTQMQVNKLNLTGAKYEKFRHIYFSMHLASYIGPVRTKAFTDAYERYQPNPEALRAKDLEYNSIGRDFAEKYKNLNNEQKINVILKAL